MADSFNISIFRYWDLTTLQAMLTGQISTGDKGQGNIVSYEIMGVQQVTRIGNMTREQFIESVNWALSFKDPANCPPLPDRTRSSFCGSGLTVSTWPT